MFAKAIFSAERRKFDFRGLLRSFDRALVGHFLDLCRRSFVKLLLRGRGWPRFPETSWACGHWYTVSCILSLGGSFISDIDMFRANAFSITCPLTLCRGVTKAYENFFSFPEQTLSSSPWEIEYFHSNRMESREISKFQRSEFAGIRNPWKSRTT